MGTDREPSMNVIFCIYFFILPVFLCLLVFEYVSFVLACVYFGNDRKKSYSSHVIAAQVFFPRCSRNGNGLICHNGSNFQHIFHNSYFLFLFSFFVSWYLFFFLMDFLSVLHLAASTIFSGMVFIYLPDWFRDFST